MHYGMYVGSYELPHRLNQQNNQHALSSVVVLFSLEPCLSHSLTVCETFFRFRFAVQYTDEPNWEATQTVSPLKFNSVHHTFSTETFCAARKAFSILAHPYINVLRANTSFLAWNGRYGQIATEIETQNCRQQSVVSHRWFKSYTKCCGSFGMNIYFEQSSIALSIFAIVKFHSFIVHFE